MRIASLGLLVVGAVAIVFGALWAAVVFPGFKRIPTDYQQAVDFEGTYALLAEGEFLQRLLSNPAVQRVVASPSTLALLARPETQRVLASDALRTLAANPALLASLLANPATAQALPNSALGQFLANPAVQALLADRTVLQLLADPEGVKVMTDPRTLSLLADPTSLKLQEIPVKLHRVRTAKETRGGVLFLEQDFSASVAGTGQALTQFSRKTTLAVDRGTRLYVPGGSEPRSGGFAFPSDVSKGAEYSIWVHEVYQPLKARFVRTDQEHGLEVYTFQVVERGLALARQAKIDQGVPETLDLAADVELRMKTEPKTGITVGLESTIRYNLQNAVLGNPTVFSATIQTTPQSVAGAAIDAKDAKHRLFWFGVFLPWSVLGLGVVLVIAGGLLASGLRRRAGARPR